jgi:hypothetical protein
MQGIKNGKIDVVKVEGIVFSRRAMPTGSPAIPPSRFLRPRSQHAASMFDPQTARDEQHHRAYRQISAGPYVLGSGRGLNMRIEGMTIDDVGLRPSRLQLPALLAMIPPAGAAPPLPVQARELIETAAGLYQDIRIGNAEMRGLSFEAAQAPLNSRPCG